jgi:hypothetical protein
MSTPTPGSDPNFTQGGAPQGQPGWGAPQQSQGYGAPQGYNAPQAYGNTPQGYGNAPQGYGAPGGFGAGGQRPGTVTAAAIIAIVWGSLGALFGLLALSLAFVLGAFYGLIILISVALSVVLLVAGIFVLQGKNPKLLLMISYVAIGVSVLSLVIGLAQGGSSAFSGILGILIPGAIVALLLQPQSKQYFASRGMSY